MADDEDTPHRLDPYVGEAPDEVGDSDDVVPAWITGCRPFDVDPLDVYLHGSDPTNDELPPDDLFGPYRADDPDMTPLGKLLYGTSEPPPDPDEDRPT